MGSMMKNDSDMLTIQIKGDGPIGGITVTADSKGNVKGYVEHPEVMLPPNAQGKLDVAGALGIGLISVIKDMGLKEPYVGQTILQTSEIAEDLTYYFATSEQVPSSVGLGVLMEHDNTVKQAGGFIVQLMPFVDDDVVDRLEANIKKISSVTSMLDKGMTLSLTAFGGVCSIAQTNCMLEGTGLSIFPYFLQKLITAILCGMLSALFFQLFV